MHKRVQFIGVLAAFAIVQIQAITFTNKTDKEISIDVFFSPTPDFAAEYDRAQTSTFQGATEIRNRIDSPTISAISVLPNATVSLVPRAFEHDKYQNIPYAFVVSGIGTGATEVFAEKKEGSAYYAPFKRLYPNAHFSFGFGTLKPSYDIKPGGFSLKKFQAV